uniref:Polynucleotide 5'-hydroxyl-kinase NOL9 n=1 Tax=Gouania willdenowi TaxID=441366 RepID=A0A8C5HPM8_GOUWI
MTMKVNKPPQVKGKSQKWKDVRGRRSRPPVTSSDLTSSPVPAAAIKKHKVSVNRKPSVKRLKKAPKPVVDRGSNSTDPGFRKPPAQANGSSTLALENESIDWQEWKEYSSSVYGNGVEETQENTEEAPGGRLEGEALHHCAQRGDGKNHVVLVMQKEQTLCFRGKCFLTCLYGRVEVMGFTIEEGQQSYPLYSPASHSPLNIRCLESPAVARDDRAEASLILQQYLLPASRKKLLKKVRPNSSIILLEPIETPLTRFLSSFSELSKLFSPPISELLWHIFIFIVVLRHVSLVKRPFFFVSTGDMDGCAVILVCGAKNVGKSTFNRFLINTLLNHTASVDYLEADLGQTEFTPSGCLSLTTVTDPLLGPPFTHQQTPDHMIYYGESSCESDLDRYLESLKSLWRRRSQSQERTLVINTMGWVKGFGLQLLVDMIRLFPVTHVVQLCHSGVTQCPALTSDYVRTADGYQTRPPAQTALEMFTESPVTPRSYTHFLVQSEFLDVGRQGTAKHQRTNEQRELSMLGYLSQLQSDDPGPVRALHSLTPYQVPYMAVALGVLHCEVEPSHMFYASNASLVGLCCLAEKVESRRGPVLLSQAPICPCVGFGVLRGIDVERGLYFLLTPIDPSILRKVNCLLLGAVTLPSCVLTAQVGLEGEKPYVTSDYIFDLSGAGKMRVFKGMLRPSLTASR